MPEIYDGDPGSREARALFAASDALMNSLFPVEENHLVYDDALTKEGSVFVMVREGEEILGCGAYVPYEAGRAEIKRMYVSEAARGKGVGRQILEELERRAAAAGIQVLSLETGTLLREALSLYTAFGYRPCPPFADYQPSEYSLFYEKRLT